MNWGCFSVFLVVFDVIDLHFAVSCPSEHSKRGCLSRSLWWSVAQNEETRGEGVVKMRSIRSSGGGLTVAFGTSRPLQQVMVISLLSLALFLCLSSFSLAAKPANSKLPNMNVTTTSRKGYRLGNPSSKITVEIFLDPICPFSGRLFKKLYTAIGPMQTRKYTQFVAYLYIQPWHFQSSLIGLVAAGVGHVDPSRYFEFLKAMYDSSEQLMDSAVENLGKQEIMEIGIRIAEQANVDGKRLRSVLEPGNPEYHYLVQQIKTHTRYGRQNSINFTPSFIVNGITDHAISSAWNPAKWDEHLEKTEQSM